MFTSIPTLLELTQSEGSEADAAPPNNALIGSRVRSRRISRGLTRQQVSRQLGIRGDDLASYEAGEKRINASLLLQMANKLEVRPDFFFRPLSEIDAKAA